MSLIKVGKLIAIFLMTQWVLHPAISQDQEIVEGEAQGGWKKIQMPFNYQNIQVPRELWQNIKDILRKDGAADAQLENFSVLPVIVQVDLMSDDRFVLREALNYNLTFVEGGGDLDLFDYVVGKGPFHIRFSPALNESSKIHLLYVSDSPGKQMGGKNWGNGCGRIYNLTEKSDLFFFDDGIRVTSSRRQYLHLMAGTFVFFQLVDDRVYLGYIRLKDSRYPNFNCHSQ